MSQQVKNQISIDNNTDGTYNVFVHRNVTLGGRTLASKRHSFMYCTEAEADAFRSYFSRVNED